MDLGSLFVIIAMLILVGLFVSRPFFSKTQPDVDVENSADHELSELLAERDQILNALQELDFDAGLGKIPSEDYPSQRAQLLQQGAEILRRLDAIQENGTHETDSKPEDRIEAAVAARRADAALVEGSAGTTKPVANGSDETADDEMEILLANRRRERHGKAIGFCAQCGGPLQKTDLFCPKCGKKLG